MTESSPLSERISPTARAVNPGSYQHGFGILVRPSAALASRGQWPALGIRLPSPTAGSPTAAAPWCAGTAITPTPPFPPNLDSACSPVNPDYCFPGLAGSHRPLRLKSSCKRSSSPAVVLRPESMSAIRRSNSARYSGSSARFKWAINAVTSRRSSMLIAATEVLTSAKLMLGIYRLTGSLAISEQESKSSLLTLAGENSPYGMNRGGGGNEVNGLMTFCHDARKDSNIGSHWPNQECPHASASPLLFS